VARPASCANALIPENTMTAMLDAPRGSILTPTSPASPPVLQVPLADLRIQYRRLRQEILQALDETAESTAFCLGQRVAAFEKVFAAYLGVRHCIGVNSGTSALHLALLGAGVAPGEEVITVPLTFIATSWGISYTGARPVYVDVDPVTYTM